MEWRPRAFGAGTLPPALSNAALVSRGANVGMRYLSIDTPPSACFNTATICPTLNGFCFTANSRSCGLGLCQKLTLEVDQDAGAARKWFGGS